MALLLWNHAFYDKRCEKKSCTFVICIRFYTNNKRITHVSALSSTIYCMSLYVLLFNKHHNEWMITSSGKPTRRWRTIPLWRNSSAFCRGPGQPGSISHTNFDQQYAEEVSRGDRSRWWTQWRPHGGGCPPPPPPWFSIYLLFFYYYYYFFASQLSGRSLPW